MQRRPDKSNASPRSSCLECGDESDEAAGWRAYLDEDELLVYCAGLRRPRIRLLAPARAPSLG